MFDVTLDGRPHQELHVDGGTFAQAFLYPASATRARRASLARNRRVAPAKARVIRNGRLDANWAETNRRTMSIAGRAVQTMIATSGLNDLPRTYFMTQRDGIGFNLAYITRDLTMEHATPFDPAYMRALYDYGQARARPGFDWTRAPPGAA